MYISHVQQLIDKYGKHLLPIALGLVAFYDRFIVLEMEITNIRNEFSNELKTINEMQQRDEFDIQDHEQRLRRLECK